MVFLLVECHLKACLELSVKMEKSTKSKTSYDSVDLKF